MPNWCLRYNDIDRRRRIRKVLKKYVRNVVLHIWNRNTLFLESSVWMCVFVRECARASECVRMYADISWSTRSTLTGQDSFS